jgi:transcription-repair coupling factor (superfamily II helicase)
MRSVPITEGAADSLARLRRLPDQLEGCPGFREALAALAARGRATFDGVCGSSCALLAAAQHARSTGPLVIVLPHAGDVDGLCDDLAIFTPTVPGRFPAWETERDERTLRDEVYGERLRTLKSLLRPQESGAPPPLLVASIQSLLQPAPSRQELSAGSRWLRVGDQVDLDELLRWLVQQRFHHTTAVELPGEFSARGGILDIFAPDWQQPVRIEFAGDQIDSLRGFDLATQRGQGKRESVEITATESTSTAAAHFTDYLPESSCILLVEPEQIEKNGQHYLQLLERPGEMHALPAVMQQLQRFAVATASALATGELGTACRLPIETIERFSGEFGRVREELDRAAGGQEVYIICATEAEIERLGDLLRETEPSVVQRLRFSLGHLRQGFRFLAAQTIVLSANELFARGEVRRISRRRLSRPIDSFLDLRAGDLVVHLSHGIGRYRGIELLDKQGQVEEHLQIEFFGGAKVYVPATKIDLVQKYVGGTKSRPTLARLGGTTWLRQKKAAESAVMDMASEMLDMQAQRVSRPGIAFAPDGQWQNEFDAAFPYEETADQLAAIQAIKQDMLQARPMDRLLCGDVGFGKTEVAMRATFKAVDSGFQVAVLVPTTVLAEQHYHTFLERMAEFPFDVARLSRFCSGKEEKGILQGLAAGRIDIVVGTHRLASRDVRFHNLGLVIIDEEQRFGVEVKERLKSLRSTVDVLTMTATPIPRTLHMSLIGVRDISNLQTAPEDRLNVETRVTRFNQDLIRHAVLRELNRGGQIFFVHNRVEDIEVVATKLRQCVPEASLRIGHGQMPEDELERVMVDFVAHRFDLLLATTIVENGLDIPNANTIFIDEADRYGLADLHQLRGRVGRYKHRAYCYLLVDPHKHITPNAAKRLHAIEEYSEIGAGFALSMRDLEIRGAGNLLGVQQSGHIATVGYELYCQLLETAVRRLKQLPTRLAIEVDIDLPGAAFLPDSYVPEIRAKIDLYRRLRRAGSYAELGEFRAELRDRFGPLPPAAQRLVDLAEVRLDAATWQITVIRLDENNLVFEYADRSRAQQLSRRQPSLRIIDDRCIYRRLPPEKHDPRQLLTWAKSMLRPP